MCPLSIDDDIFYKGIEMCATPRHLVRFYTSYATVCVIFPPSPPSPPPAVSEQVD